MQGNNVATGQVGPAPVAFVWDATTGEKKQRFKLPKGARGIRCISLSNGSKYVACVDMSNNHSVYVYDVSSGAQIFTQEGDTADIIDCCFNQQQGQYNFITAGAKHVKFWYPEEKKCEKALFGTKGEVTNFNCATYDQNGVAYTGGLNSLIYVWKGRDLEQTLSIHKGGSVSALQCFGQTLISGGKDGNINIISVNGYSVTKSINVGSLIRGISQDSKGNLFVGTAGGNIFKFDQMGNKAVVQSSHCEGEVWGLGLSDNHTIVTCGDDNQVKVWDMT